jgi:hypothetical protein
MMRGPIPLLILAATIAAGSAPRAQQGASAPAPETGTSAISGTVTDGLTGRPLPGAVVYVGITGQGAVGRVSRQLTDSKGRFVFVDLPAHERYFLNASHFGYVNGGHGVRPTRPAPTRIRLADGEWFKDAAHPAVAPGRDRRTRP